MKTEVVLDFETCNPYCDLTKVGSRVYAEHWATEILCLSFRPVGRMTLLWVPSFPADRLRDYAENPEALFIAHNVGFEKDIWREIMVRQYDFPDIPNERWHDTMSVCALKAVPLSLEKALPVLGLGEKDKDGSKLTISLSKFGRITRKTPKSVLPERTPAVMQRVYDYCAKDVDDEVALHDRLGYLPDAERCVWLLDQTTNERGLLLDCGFIAGAQRVVDLARDPLLVEFRELTGLEPGQTAAVVKWAQAQGVELPNLQKGTIAELLGETEDTDDEDAGILGAADRRLSDLPGNVRRALAIRSLVGSSSISKLSRMEACISRDGRVHRLLQYHGTGPGRWAGRLFNPLNFPRGIAKTRDHKTPDPEILADLVTPGRCEDIEALGLQVEDPPNSGHWRDANPIEVVASALRHAIIAAPGHTLMEMDFTQTQARIVLALAGQHDFLDLLRAGHDPYLLMAEGIFGAPRGSLTKAAHPEKRQFGKNTFLGCGFQMGPSTFCQKFTAGCACKPGTRPCEHPDSAAYQQAAAGIRGYREIVAPMVPPVWYALEDAALRTVVDRRPHEAYGIRYELEDGWLTARLLDGKKIYYWNPQRASPREGWTKDCWTYQTTKMGRMVTVYAYGGLLTENVVMGHERQLLVRAMLQCEKENLPVIFNGYDAIVAEPELAHANPEHLKQIMCDPPDWAREIKLPIDAEGWVGNRYRKG